MDQINLEAYELKKQIDPIENNRKKLAADSRYNDYLKYTLNYLEFVN